MGWWLALLPALYVLVVGGLALAQRRLVFQPDRTRPDAAAVEQPGLREVTCRTADGLDLLAWHLPAPEGAPTLLYLHGNGGNLMNRARRLRRFAAAGLGVFMPEYRGYGGNPGAPSEAGFRLDAAAALGCLRAAGVPEGRIVVYGESIGTSVAAGVAADRAVAAVVLESPFSSIAEIAARQFPFAPVRLLMRDPFETLPLVARLRAPLLVIQGLRDRVVPPALGQALFAAAPEPKTLWQAPEGGHEDLMQHGAGEVVLAFLRLHAGLR